MILQYLTSELQFEPHLTCKSSLQQRKRIWRHSIACVHSSQPITTIYLTSLPSQQKNDNRHPPLLHPTPPLPPLGRDPKTRHLLLHLHRQPGTRHGVGGAAVETQAWGSAEAADSVYVSECVRKISVMGFVFCFLFYMGDVLIVCG